MLVHRMPEVVAVQVLMLLRQGSLTAAADLAQQYDLPMSRARVLLSQGNPSTALAVLGPYRQQVEAKNWQDERLKVMVLHAVALHAHGEMDKAVQLLGEALALAEPGGFIRIFVDEGEPMRLLILDFRLWIERQGVKVTSRSSMWTNFWRPLHKQCRCHSQKSSVPLRYAPGTLVRNQP